MQFNKFSFNVSNIVLKNDLIKLPKVILLNKCQQVKLMHPIYKIKDENHDENSNNNFKFQKFIKNVILICIFNSCAYAISKIYSEKDKFNNYWFKRFILQAKANIKQDDKDLLENISYIPASKKYNFIADVVEKAESCVVGLEVWALHPYFNTDIRISTGSGFIVNSEGLILTNAHVVGESKEVTVKLQNGKIYNGKVEAVDNHTDLATISIPETNLPYLKFCESKNVRAGEFVIAMGSPFSLNNTVTVGVISSTTRLSSELGILNKEMQYIQTDASINIGNSGGPLVNLDGTVVGINTMKVTSGISFAIPSEYAVQFLKAIELQKKIKTQIKKPFVPERKRSIGVTMLSLNNNIIQHLKSRLTNINLEHGVLIMKVINGSPAEKAGLQAGDILLEVNNKKALSATDVYRQIDSNKVLNFTILKGDKKVNLKIFTDSLDS